MKPLRTRGDESIEKSQGASHAVDVGGTSVVPYDLARNTCK